MFLKNKNIIFKIRRSKVTDYAALRAIFVWKLQENNLENLFCIAYIESVEILMNCLL